MDKKKRNLIFSGGFILLAIIFTILVKTVDVQAIGPKGTSVGFSQLNHFIFEMTGVNMIFHDITEWLGLIPIAIAFIYAFIGLFQLIKRKSIFKIDREILILGLFYVVVITLYLLFEVVIINYRPVLIDGFIEASYPSSHTVLAICICGSSIILNHKLFAEKKLAKIENVIAIGTMLMIIGGRFISGVHWFTDILGGILISIALLMSFATALSMTNSHSKPD